MGTALFIPQLISDGGSRLPAAVSTPEPEGAAAEARRTHHRKRPSSAMGAAFISVLSVALVAASVARAQAPASACRGTQHPQIVAELLFGRDIDKHLGVSEAAWARFMAREVTPRFPDGLTVTDAFGQWRAHRGGRIVREPSKVVTIVLPGHQDDQSRLDAVVEAYKRQFHQRSVAVIEQFACVSF